MVSVLISDVRNRDNTVDIKAYEVRMTIAGESVESELVEIVRFTFEGLDFGVIFGPYHTMIDLGTEKCLGMAGIPQYDALA